MCERSSRSPICVSTHCVIYPMLFERHYEPLGIPQPRVHVNSPNVEGHSNILKLQATFLYSIYHQRAGKTNLFHMRGGRFHAGNTLYTFKAVSGLSCY